MSSYRDVEAEFAELAELRTFSAAWYRRWRDLHAERYPDCDLTSRANLDMLVDLAEKREAAA